MFPNVTRKVAIMAAASAIGLSACGSAASPSAAPASAAPATAAPATEAPTAAATEVPSAAPSIGSMGKIGFSVPINNEFTQCMATGVIAAANAAGYDVELAQGNFDDNDVIGDFDKFISEKVKGIVVLPSSDNSASKGTLNAAAAGIPVVNAGWFSETPADSTWVGRLKVDVASGAGMIADWMGKNTQAAPVVFVAGAPGLPTNDAFEAALGPAIDKLGGAWKLVGTEPGFYTRDGALKAIENLMTAHPDAKIVVALSADMADGVVKWAKDNNRTDLTIISGDSDLALVPNMKSGAIKSDLYWGPAEQGGLATGLLLKNLADGSKSTDITPIPISIETVDSIENTIQTRPICIDQFMDQAAQMP